MGNTSSKWSRARAVFSNGDALGTISKVGGDKGESRVKKAKSRGKSFKENLMVYGVEGGG